MRAVVVTRVAVFGKRMPGKRPLRSPTARTAATLHPAPRRPTTLHLFTSVRLLCISKSFRDHWQRRRRCWDRSAAARCCACITGGLVSK